MPRRTNEFQQLVHAIHHQLHESATVRESVLVPDRNNGPALEVDILIDDKSGEYTFVIGVECIDHKRPADIGWVLQMSKKHENRTDKLVLVSRSGFSKNALKQAADNGIVTLKLSDALDVDWTEFVSRKREIGIGMFVFKVEQGYVVLDKGEGAEAYIIAPELMFHELDGRPSVTADEIANHILHHPDVVTFLMDTIHKRPDLKWAQVENPMSREVIVEDVSGAKHIALAIRLDVSWAVDVAPMSLNANALGDVPVSWGTATVQGQELFFVATERKEKGFSATLRAKSEDNEEPQLVDMKPFPESPLKYKILEVPEEYFLE